MKPLRGLILILIGVAIGSILTMGQQGKVLVHGSETIVCEYCKGKILPGEAARLHQDCITEYVGWISSPVSTEDMERLASGDSRRRAER